MTIEVSDRMRVVGSFANQACAMDSTTVIAFDPLIGGLWRIGFTAFAVYVLVYGLIDQK